MSNDSEAHEVQATVIGSGRHEARSPGDRTQPSDVVDAEIIDPDAVIIDQEPAHGGAEGGEADALPRSNGANDPDVIHGSTTAGVPLPRRVTADGAGVPPGTATADDAGAEPGDPVLSEPRGSGTSATAGVRPPDDAAVTGEAGADLAGDEALMHERWAAIQSSFVDDPRASVAAAADLVGEAISTLVASARQRERGLRSEWDRDGVDTEDLRHALRSYRGFLDRIAAL